MEIGIEQTVHRCCCVTEHEKRFRCTQLVAGSDNPFCQNCEDRHPIFVNFGITVTQEMP